MFCGASLPSPILSRRNSIHALEEPVKKTGVFVAGLYGYLLKRELRGKQQGPGLFHADLLNVFPEAFSLILFEKEIIVIPMVMKNLLEAGGGHVRSVQTDIPLQLALCSPDPSCAAAGKRWCTGDERGGSNTHG